MINRLRWKLTAFNSMITGLILLSMTLLCLFVSERDTRARAFQAFSGTLGTITTYLEGQNHLSLSWQQQMESAGGVYISIREGSTPLYSANLSPTRNRLAPEFRLGRELANQLYGLDVSRSRSAGSCAFSLTGSDGNRYYAGVALIPKSGTMLELTVLCPLDNMENGIQRQRLVVCLGELLALGLLWIFSWHFTGKVLQPIVENQQRQAQFTAAASHELRTPLAAMLSAASAMERAEPDQQERFGRIIRQEGQRMTRLIGDLLTLASADNQNWHIQPIPVELDMLLLEVYETYLPQAREKGLTLELHLPETKDSVGYVDKERIIQVLAILLDNALFYTPSPGRIGLGISFDRSSVRITVSDTGPGIPEQDKQRIFERFCRGEKSRSDRNHFGLGLSIAAEITRLHRGKLWVENPREGGSVFILELSRKDRAGAERCEARRL